MIGRHRLRRLEARLSKEGGRCRLCRDRPGQVLIIRRGEQPCSEEDTMPCAACGWQPEVIEVTEVVIHTRAQWEQLRNGESLSEGP
jgi:hypothetical protein